MYVKALNTSRDSKQDSDDHETTRHENRLYPRSTQQTTNPEPTCAAKPYLLHFHICWHVPAAQATLVHS